MSMIETPLMQRLSHFLDATANRSGVIANNIANIDTPGYHARDLDFRSQLTSIMSSDAQPTSTRVVEVPIDGLEERGGKVVAEDLEGLGAGGEALPCEGNAGGFKDAEDGLGYFRADAVAGNQGHLGAFAAAPWFSFGTCWVVCGLSSFRFGGLVCFVALLRFVVLSFCPIQS